MSIGSIGTPRLYSIPETRVRLGGAGRSTVYELVARKLLDGVKVGRRTMITEESIQRYIDGLPSAQIRLPARDRRKALREAERASLPGTAGQNGNTTGKEAAPVR